MERALSLKREIDSPDSSGLLYAKPWFCFLVGLFCLLAGVVVGGLFFPQKVVQLITVEKRVEVPVNRITEKRVEVPVEVIKYLDRMVPVEKIVYPDRAPSVFAPQVPSAWSHITRGMSEREIRGLIGEPRRIEPGEPSYWYYGDDYFVRVVQFIDGRVDELVVAG